MRKSALRDVYLIEMRESSMAWASVVNVSQVITVDKSLLREKVGTLSRQRVQEIAAGLRLVFEPREL